MEATDSRRVIVEQYARYVICHVLHPEMVDDSDEEGLLWHYTTTLIS